ncbi:MAG: DUF4363 family protein [Clostridia bacterium]|nr:DUF4363 family protein [Clostridia bacterium]
MKIFAGAMVALLIIIVGTNIYSDRMNNTLDSMKKYIDEIIDFADKEEWQNCSQTFYEFNKQWHKDEKWFSAFIHGDKISLINEVLNELETFIGYENTEQTVAKSKVLKNHLKSISENEQLSAENIL